MLKEFRGVQQLSGAEPHARKPLVQKLPPQPARTRVFEVWRSEADHAASVKRESVKALIGRAG